MFVPMLSFTEENYLKALLKLTSQNPEKQEAGTNEMAAYLGVKPATATDMLKKLKEKELVSYQKYGKILLTDTGKQHGVAILRKHRLWETFLFEKLDFSWDEVHDVAEQLEHIKSEKLTDKLEEFLEFPTEDPHGDPIPDRSGKLPKMDKKLLSEINAGKKVICVGVKDSSPPFLQYLDKQQIALGSGIEVLAKEDFDHSLQLRVDGKEVTVSNKIAANLFVKTI